MVWPLHARTTARLDGWLRARSISLLLTPLTAWLWIEIPKRFASSIQVFIRLWAKAIFSSDPILGSNSFGHARLCHFVGSVHDLLLKPPCRLPFKGLNGGPMVLVQKLLIIQYQLNQYASQFLKGNLVPDLPPPAKSESIGHWHQGRVR